MEGKNEIMNIMDYEVVDTRSNDIRFLVLRLLLSLLL